MGIKTTRGSELGSLTISMLLNLVFTIVVFWAFPFIPMIVAIVYSLPTTTFLTIWLIGLPFSGATFFYLLRKGR